MTAEEQQIEPDLNEEAMHADGDQVVPNPQEERSMVATSAEVLFCLTLFKCHSLSFSLFCCSQSAICHVVWLQALEELGLDAVDLVDEAPSFFESTSQEQSE